MWPALSAAQPAQASPETGSSFGQASEESGLRFGPATQPVAPAPTYQPPAAPPVPRHVPEEANDTLEEGSYEDSPELSPPPERHRPARIAPSRPRTPSGPVRQAPPVAEVVQIAGPLERLRQTETDGFIASRLSLIRQSVSSEVQQKPTIAAADGKSALQLVFRAHDGNTPPDLALSNLKLRRLFRGSDGHWVLDALAHENVWDARVFVMGKGKTLSVPVVVAPLVNVDFNVDGRIDESDYVLLLDAMESADPTFDLNGDGVVDHVDEFIFLANYLLQGDESPSSPY